MQETQRWIRPGPCLRKPPVWWETDLKAPSMLPLPREQSLTEFSGLCDLFLQTSLSPLPLPLCPRAFALADFSLWTAHLLRQEHHCPWSLSSGVLSPRTTSHPKQGTVQAPRGPWASSSPAIIIVLCTVTLYPSFPLSHFTDVETEAQEGEVTWPKQSRTGAQPGAVSLPGCKFYCFPQRPSPRAWTGRCSQSGKAAEFLCNGSCAGTRFPGSSPERPHPPEGPAA